MNITNYTTIISTNSIPIMIVYTTIINTMQYDTMDWCYDKSLVYDGFYEDMINKFYTDKTSIDWKLLSCNPLAIELLEDNMDKVVWEYFIMNPVVHDMFAIIENG